MVSKASEDLPEPERPVNTISRSRGISTSMFLRLCSRAPRMAMMRASGRRLWSNRSFMRSVEVDEASVTDRTDHGADVRNIGRTTRLCQCEGDKAHMQLLPVGG